MRLTRIDRFRGKHFFLSNFSPAVVIFEGVKYPTSEHAYQASKSIMTSVRESIAELTSPADAKYAGRQIALRPDWDEAMALRNMETVVRIKFLDLPLATKLIETSPAALIEGNDWGDGFWGQSRGVGHNHMGKILMKIRAECRRRLIN